MTNNMGVIRCSVLAVALLVACGDGGSETSATTTAPTTSTTVDQRQEATDAYCRLMERTEADIDAGGTIEAGEAMIERIRNSPAELRRAWIDFNSSDRETQREAIVTIQDWTQANCGFLPKFR